MGHDPNVLFSNLEADLVPHTVRRDGKYISVANLDCCVGARTAAANHLLNSVLKKFRNGTSEDADKRAIEKFLHANKVAGEWSLDLQTSRDELLWGTLRQVWYEFTHGGECQTSSFHFPKWGLAVGPGSNVGARDCDYYTKVWDSPLTCTSEGLYETYARYVHDWYGQSFHGETVRELSYGHQVVGGCKLVCVLKNVDISRVIFTEPTLNMMFQQGLRQQLEARLASYFGIDIRTQQYINRALASVGSSYWGMDVFTFSTVDLESASDYVGIPLLDRLSAKDCELLSFLKSFRSPKSEVNGEWVDLNMVGTMGNSTTFPLQTAIFAAICRAAIRLSGGGWERAHPHATGQDWSAISLPAFTVFGDDIIVPNRATPLVLRMLEICGFKVNRSKSFTEGPFRESCGADFWKGVNIRGVYIQDLDTPQSLCHAYNSLTAWSIRHDIPLVRTLRGLYKSLKAKGVGIVPGWEATTSGLRVSMQTLKYEGELRSSSMLKSFLPPRISENGVWKYAKYEAFEKQVQALEDRIDGPKGSPLRHLNKGGLRDALLGGYIKDGKWSIREIDPVYRQRYRVALNWDYRNTLDVDDELSWGEKKNSLGYVVIDPPPLVSTYAEAYEDATQEKGALDNASDETWRSLERRVFK